LARTTLGTSKPDSPRPQEGDAIGVAATGHVMGIRKRRDESVLPPGTFYGRTISQTVSDAVLSEVVHDLGRTVASHRHAASYFSLLLEGSYRETAHELTVAYEPFTLVYHAARTEHTDTIGPNGCRLFFVELLPRWNDVMALLGPQPEHLVELNGGEPAWLALRLYQDVISGALDPLTVEALLYELCDYAVSSHMRDTTEPPWLVVVDRVVQSQFIDGLNLGDIASEAAVSPSQLCRAFRRFRGKSIGDYILGLRIQRVCRRLAETSMPLRDVAAEAGFADQSHMTNAFRRAIGSSPGSYRRKVLHAAERTPATT
jgi:AraC family transcriptional regulator